MTLPSALWTALLLCSLFAYVQGQTCTLYEPSGSKCDSFFANKPIYLASANSTQALIEATQVAPKVAGLGAFIPQICRSLGIQLICASSYLTCNIVNGSFAGVLFPCLDLCESMVLACNLTFWTIGAESQLPPCSPAVFPSTNCVNITSYLAPTYTQADCPYPLKIDEDYDQSTLINPIEIPSQLCVYPCPDPEFSTSEYNGGWVVSYVLGFISFFTGLFMLTTWLLAPEDRRFPRNVIIWLVLCATGVAAATIWPVFWGGVDNVVCTTQHPPQPVRMSHINTNHDAGCIIQGIVLFYCALAANLWWLAICIYLFEAIVINLNPNWVKWFFRAYHVLGWGYPLVALAIALGSEQIGASATSSYCFLGDYLGSETDYNGYLYGLYVGPSFLCLIIGSILTFIAFGVFAVNKFKLRKRTTLTYFWAFRLLSIVMFGWWLFMWINIEAIYGSVKIPELETAVKNQAQCSLLSGTDCPYIDTANYGILWINLYNSSSAATVMFICCGLSTETFLFWWRLGKAIFFKCSFTEIWEVLTVVPDGEEDEEGGEAMKPQQNAGHSAEEESSSSAD